MLQELFNLVKGVAQESVINNPDVPNDRNNEVVAEATNTVASGLRNIVAGGGLQNLLSLFGSGGQQSGRGLLNNPIVNMMIGHFSEKLMSKYNLGGAQANNVANNLIPNVIGDLINKTNDPGNSSFSLENLLSSITGGRSMEVAQEQQSSGNAGFNLPDLISQFGGGGGQSGGGGLMDIVSKMAQGAQAQQQKNGGGGLMDLIKGFMK
ncbi:MAG: hypothetical protein H7122_01775 [Chitinophagaceae bacterium]|nr:hypothetical protein [Chitinophagaceae bacterium]